MPEINQGSLSESDVFFIGANKGRYKHLLLIYDKLSNAGLKCDFFICDVAKKEQIKKDGIVYNKRITYDEVLKHIKASKCVLEVLQNGIIVVNNFLYFFEIIITSRIRKTENQFSTRILTFQVIKEVITI